MVSNEGSLVKWELKTIEEVTTQVGDIDHKMPQSTQMGIPYIMTGDFIGNNEIDFKNAKKISETDFAELSSKIEPDFGDILFARYASVGTVRLVKTNQKFLVSYSCAIIKPKNYELGVYLYYCLLSNHAKKQVELSVNAGTQKNVGIESIKKIVIPVPPKAEYVAIAEALSDADSLITSLEKLIAKKKAIKQGAMQELLTGKKRLPGLSGEWIVKTVGELFYINGGLSASREQLSQVGYCYLHYL